MNERSDTDTSASAPALPPHIRDLCMTLGVRPTPPTEDVDVDLMNWALVGSGGAAGGVCLLRPIGGDLSSDQALVLAAYLVLMADDGHGRFASILQQVANT